MQANATAVFVVAALASALFSNRSAAQTPTFEGLGDLSGGANASAAAGISADGSVVVGESEGANGTEGFRWTPAGGIMGLGFLSMSDPFSTATGVSDDGSVVVGSSHDGSDIVHAFRWSASTMTALNTFSCANCDPVTEGSAVSGDGLVVVGSAAARGGGTSPLHIDPVRWAGGGTSISDLGNLTGGDEVGGAFGASSDGSVISGNHLSGNGKDAWYWSGAGLNALPTITGGSIIAATADAVSSDGTVIAGYSNQATIVLPGGTEVATDLQAVRWTGTGYAVLEQLGAFPGAVSTDSAALALSQDGSIVVGRALNSNLSDRAFIWDASGGMRDLKTVLETDYGLDLGFWILSEATAISDVVAGDFSIAGTGINELGETEAWVAFLTTPACSDGVDNEPDGLTDYPADPGCTGPTDFSEDFDCEDGLDNDDDSNVDHPNDSDCVAANDPTEQPDCSDGIDNDGDGDTDYPADVGCASPDSQVEDPACSDAADNDIDTFTDYPADPECLSASDASETADCSDGLDNDGDTLIDFGSDPECESAADLSEAPQCSDAIDNDGNSEIDYPAEYPSCLDADDPVEGPQCGDGIDNDNDGDTDYPNDTACDSLLDESENPIALSSDDLVVVDRTSRAVFRVDPVTGVQTLISEKALMQAPQGIVERGDELVVADPAGLIAVSASGSQRLASAPLTSNDSLQMVLDSADDVFVLEADGISLVVWNPTGLGSKSTWMAMPTPGPFSVISIWDGDTLAREQSGHLITTGLSLFGDGVSRVDPFTQAPTILLPGFDDLKWLDLAVEADSTILAVGFKYDQSTGVYRVDPLTGVATALNNTYGWQLPTGVAVDSSGDIYVTDAGNCSAGTCFGGQIVHVDPSTGIATQISTGGFIAGEMDIAVAVPEPGIWVSFLFGSLLLVWMKQARTAGQH